MSRSFAPYSKLSLHHLTVLDVSPAQLIDTAAALGCAHVDFFTYVPERGKGIYPCVTPDDVPALRDKLESAGVTVCNLEVFPLDGDILRFDEALRVGAALGARHATAQLYDMPSERVGIHRFADFCGMASDYGIVPGLEFHAFTAIKDILSAARVVREAGCGKLVLDSLHLMRNGAQIEAVAENADLITFAQLSDGPLVINTADAWHEAIRERGIPGEGQFPLDAIITPLAADVVFDIEVPQTAAMKAGVTAFRRAERAVLGATTILDAVFSMR